MSSVLRILFINLKYLNGNTFQNGRRHTSIMCNCINKQHDKLTLIALFRLLPFLLYLSFIIALGIPASLTSTLCGLLQWKLTYYISLLSTNSLLHYVFIIQLHYCYFVIHFDFLWFAIILWPLHFVKGKQRYFRHIILILDHIKILHKRSW